MKDNKYFENLKKLLAENFIGGFCLNQENKSTISLKESAPNSLLKTVKISIKDKERYCLLKPDIVKNLDGFINPCPKTGNHHFLKLCDYVMITANIIYFFEMKSSLNIVQIEDAKLKFKSTTSLIKYLDSLLICHGYITQENSICSITSKYITFHAKNTTENSSLKYIKEKNIINDYNNFMQITISDNDTCDIEKLRTI
jgi:hypothetical protein